MEKYNQKFKQFAQDVPLLVEAGFIAIKHVDETAAKCCFYAAILANPDESLPVIGLGMIHLFKLELDEAKELFNAVLQKEPYNDMAKTMLGIAHLYSISDEGLKEGKELINEATHHTEDAEVKQLGKYSQDLMKEIKKKMKDLHPLEAFHKQPIQKRLKNK